MKTVEIATPDGAAPTYVWDNPGPCVLVLMDGVGMRQALRDIAAKIAEHGYRVVMPDLFYRLGPYTAPEPAKLFADPEAQKAWFGRVSSLMTPDNVRRDLAAYIEWTGAPKLGVVGYCMGGRFAIVAAEEFPAKVAAAAAYHPGGLVTDKPDSPHLAVAAITAKVYIGAAKDDAHMTPAMQQTLDAALTEAGVDHTVAQYQAKHGWVPSDTPIHDEAETARHYETMFALFAKTLRV